MLGVNTNNMVRIFFTFWQNVTECKRMYELLNGYRFRIVNNLKKNINCMYLNIFVQSDILKTNFDDYLTRIRKNQLYRLNKNLSKDFFSFGYFSISFNKFNLKLIIEWFTSRSFIISPNLSTSTFSRFSLA